MSIDKTEEMAMSPTSQTDPAYGKAPVPKNPAEHVVSPVPVLVPDHLQDLKSEEHFVNLFESHKDLLDEVSNGAMHDRMQSIVARGRQVVQAAQELYESVKEDLSAAVKANAKGKSTVAPLIALALFLFGFIGTTQAQIRVSAFPPQNNAAATAVGTATGGTTTNPSGNNIAIAPGPVYCGGAISLIHNTQFTLVGPPAIPATASASGQSQLFFIYYSCGTDQLIISVFPPGPTDVSISTVLQSNAAGSLSYTITDVRPAFLFPATANWAWPFGPGDCGWLNSGGTLVSNSIVNIGASNVNVNQISTSTTAATDTLTCNIHVPINTSAGKGFQVSDCTIYYGVQTTALTSLGAPTLNSITMPAPGTGETPSTVTPVSLGPVTVTPVVGSANLGLTTAGAFFSEKVALNTPVFLNTDQQDIIYQQAFAQSAGVSQVVNTPGGVCHGTYIPN